MAVNRGDKTMTVIEITTQEVERIEAQVDIKQCYNGREQQRLDLLGELLESKTGVKDLTVNERENIGLRSGLRVRVGQEIEVMEFIKKTEGFDPDEYSKLARCLVPNQDNGRRIAPHPETGKVVAFHQNGNISAMQSGAFSQKYYDEITSVWAISPNYKILVVA